MPYVRRLRLALPAALVVAQGACNVLVSTDGLTGNGPSTDGTDAASCTSCASDAATPTNDGDASDPDAPSEAAAPTDAASPADTGDAVDDAAACAPVSAGLVGYYTMDLDSIAGTTLIDSSGNSNNGALVGFGSTATAPGRFGQALVFPATGQAYVDVPVIPLDAISGDANSISLWYYRDGSPNDVLALLPNSPRYDLWLTSSPGDASTDTYLCINTAHNDCFGVGAPNLLGRWVHVVAVFANGGVTKGSLFVDGQPAGAACLTGAGFESCNYSAVAAAPVEFGGKDSFYFHGMLDDVRVYDRALTSSEVRTLHECP